MIDDKRGGSSNFKPVSFHIFQWTNIIGHQDCKTILFLGFENRSLILYFTVTVYLESVDQPAICMPASKKTISWKDVKKPISFYFSIGTKLEVHTWNIGICGTTIENSELWSDNHWNYSLDNLWNDLKSVARKRWEIYIHFI